MVYVIRSSFCAEYNFKISLFIPQDFSKILINFTFVNRSLLPIHQSNLPSQLVTLNILRQITGIGFILLLIIVQQSNKFYLLCASFRYCWSFIAFVLKQSLALLRLHILPLEWKSSVFIGSQLFRFFCNTNFTFFLIQLN